MRGDSQGFIQHIRGTQAHPWLAWSRRSRHRRRKGRKFCPVSLYIDLGCWSPCQVGEVWGLFSTLTLTGLRLKSSIPLSEVTLRTFQRILFSERSLGRKRAFTLRAARHGGSGASRTTILQPCLGSNIWSGFQTVSSATFPKVKCGSGYLSRTLIRPTFSRAAGVRRSSSMTGGGRHWRAQSSFDPPLRA